MNFKVLLTVGLLLATGSAAANSLSDIPSAATPEQTSDENSESVKARRSLRGKVIDAETGEEIIGATLISREDPTLWAVSGLNGSFTLSAKSGKNPLGTVVCSFIGYKDAEIACSGTDEAITIALEKADITLDAVVVSGSNHGKTEAGARGIERAALNVMNVMSAKAIELSPDVTVANVIRRMSGVTVERNSSGEGRYAILRGMDKRYNYTLVNGVKIPSPDNKNRFVPLDIFPSEMLDRLEVTKSLTADMEGDGIGGAVNLVMKDAPDDLEINANLSTGYNALFFDRDFESFDHRASYRQSPYERMGRPENYAVTADDFTTKNLRVRSARPRPDLIGGLSYGDRFFGGRLGVMAAVNYQNLFRGKNSDLYYKPGSNTHGTEVRFYSEEQDRLGAHLKLDYRPGDRHKLILYTGYMNMAESEVRNGRDEQDWTVRLKYNSQYILNTTLKGEHAFLDHNRLRLDWSGVFSRAYSTTPDNTRIYINGNHLYNTDSADRRWEHNSDRDLAGYVNLSYLMELAAQSNLMLKAGGMYRDKVRDSFFNEYTFDSATDIRNPQYYGEQWTNFDELLLKPRPYGNIGDPLNYDAFERIAAGYVMAKYVNRRFEAIAGLRVEHTDQGYELDFPRKSDPEGNQRYTDLLPSLHLKYGVQENANLRFSYGRSINRPGFFEIVPYTILNEDYDEKGNPDLRHTVADNLDLRYELFPKASEQFMVGLFWKKLYDPIEYGLVTEGQETFLKPMNFGDATNFGVEVDVMKYFNWFGIKANYTYTHSEITTDKRTMQGSEVINVRQTRPLYGQAAHVANLSLLFHFPKCGFEAQISGTYTGKRLSEVSSWLDDDIWEAGYVALDLSIEKSFRHGISLYAKASNLLNSPLVRFVNPSAHTASLADYERYKGGVIERREWNAQTVMIGIRYRFTK